jgi:hypothetical protein
MRIATAFEKPLRVLLAVLRAPIASVRAAD